MRKGQEGIVGVFSLLITVVIAGLALPAILPAQALKVTPQVDAMEFEDKAIVLANSLLADSRIVYSDGNAYQRGVFDVSKLDDPLNLFFKKGSYTSLYSCIPSPDNCKIIIYPKTYALIIIADTENGDGWFTGTNRLVSDDAGLEIVKCIQPQTEMGSTGEGKLFQEGSDLKAVLELDKCNTQRYSQISNPGFPVSIRYSDNEIHSGLLKVLVIE